MIFSLNNKCEELFLRRVWIPIKKTSSITSVSGLMVPGVRISKSKNHDYDGVNNCGWVLFCSTGSVISYPVYSNQPNCKYGMKLLRPIRTRMFAMQVRESPFWLISVSPDGNVTVPKFCSMLEGSVREYTIMSKEDIEYISIISEQPVTFV